MMQIENRMVVDSEWPDYGEVEELEEIHEPGYTNLRTSKFVPADEAYDYALNDVMNNADVRQEFVEWFYSGNWVKEE